MPRSHDLVSQAKKQRQALVDPPVVLAEERDVVGMALERSTVGHLVARVGGHPQQEIGERIAGEGAAESILPAEIHAEAEPVAGGVERPEAAAFERVAAPDPRDVVAQREGILTKRAIDVPPRIGDVGGPVRSRRELERREPATVGAEARCVLDAELRGHVGRQERALPSRVVIVVAGPELIDDRRRDDLGPAADHRRGVERGIQDRQVGERISGLEDDVVRIAVLIAPADEQRIVGARLVIDSDVGSLSFARLGHELLVDAVPVRHRSLIGQRVEEVHDRARRRIDAAGGNHLIGEGQPGGRVSRHDRGAAEVADPHRRRRNGRPATTEYGLVVRALVVAIEEQFSGDQGAADASTPAVLVRVGEGIPTLDARELLVVRQRVQGVAVEVVEARPAVAVRAALGRHHDARQAAVLGTVGVRQHRNLRDRVEARSRVADGAEDGVRRCLSVLDVRHAVRLGAQELDVIGAADHVGVEEQERLDIATVARQIVELLLIEAADNGLALERDVVVRFARDGDRLVDAAELEGDVHERRAGGSHENARSLELLEVRRDDLDAIGSRSEVRRLIAALRIGLERSGHAGRVVDDENGGAWYDLSLGIDDGTANRAQEGLRECRRAEGEDRGEY